MSSAAAKQAAAKGAAEGTAAKGTAARGVAAPGAVARGVAASGSAAATKSATEAAAKGAAATGAAPNGAAASGAAALGTGASGGAAKEVESMEKATTEAGAGGAAQPAKCLKATMGVSRASARFAVVSKRRDSCLLGNSVTESPEKLRGHHEIINFYFIEYEDDQLHREEVVETEPETQEGSEKKEVDEWTEPVQGPLPTPPLASPRRLTCSCCLEIHRDRGKFSLLLVWFQTFVIFLYEIVVVH